MKQGTLNRRFEKHSEHHSLDEKAAIVEYTNDNFNESSVPPINMIYRQAKEAALSIGVATGIGFLTGDTVAGIESGLLIGSARFIFQYSRDFIRETADDWIVQYNSVREKKLLYIEGSQAIDAQNDLFSTALDNHLYEYISNALVAVISPADFAISTVTGMVTGAYKTYRQKRLGKQILKTVQANANVADIIEESDNITQFEKGKLAAEIKEWERYKTETQEQTTSRPRAGVRS